jgi:hypothetical protein
VSDIEMRWQLQFALTGGSTLVAYGGPVAGRPGSTDSPRSERVPAWMRDIGELRDAWQASDSRASGAGALTAPGMFRALSRSACSGRRCGIRSERRLTTAQVGNYPQAESGHFACV